MQYVNFGTYSLKLPDNWTLSTVILAGPPDVMPDRGIPTIKEVKSFQRNLITTLEMVEPNETPENYFQRQIIGLKESGVTRYAVGKPEAVKIGELEGLLTEQVIIGAGGEQVRQMQLIFIKDRISHCAIASHLNGEPFESAREEFRRILLSYS